MVILTSQTPLRHSGRLSSTPESRDVDIAVLPARSHLTVHANNMTEWNCPGNDRLAATFARPLVEGRFALFPSGPSPPRPPRQRNVWFPTRPIDGDERPYGRGRVGTPLSLRSMLT